MTDHCPAVITYKGMIQMYTEDLKNIARNIVDTISPSYWSKQNLIIRPNFQEIVQSTSFLPTNIRLCARLYCILNNIESCPLCAICGKPVKYEWLGALKGFKKYCGKCQRKSMETRSKTEASMLAKYGATNVSQTEHFRIKYKQTMLKHYGVEHAMYVKEIKDRCFITHLTRHGYVPLRKYINVGKNEQTLLDEQERLCNTKIQRCYRVGRYFADGYCPNTNTIYEVYEKFHRPRSKRLQDEIRQKYIQDKLKCTFVIIWDLPKRKIEQFTYTQ